MQNLYLICNLDVISFPNVISFVHCIIYVGTQKLSRHSRLHMFPSRQQKRSKGEAKTKCQLSYYHQRTKISKTQLSANWIFIQFQAIIACTAFLRVKIFDWKCFDFYDFKNLHIKISLFSSLCCFSDFVHFVALWLPHHLLLDSLWQQKNITNCFPSEDYKYAPSTNIIECQTLGWHHTGPVWDKFVIQQILVGQSK